jgi:hypothetical protein
MDSRLPAHPGSMRQGAASQQARYDGDMKWHGRMAMWRRGVCWRAAAESEGTGHVGRKGSSLRRPLSMSTARCESSFTSVDVDVFR